MAARRKTFLKKTTKSFRSLEVRRALRIRRLKLHKARLADRHSIHFMLQQEA